MRFYTIREITFIQENSHKGSAWLAKELDIPLNSVRAAMKNRGITTGTCGTFAKGHTPWNKGKKGVRLNPGTEFKKGRLPHNIKEDGAISIRQDNSGRQYKYIRISKGNWHLLQRHIWKQHYGELPANMIITFKDGNTMNCDISNLEMISKAENARRNHNREKAAASMKITWDREKIRKLYGLKARTKLRVA